MSDKCNPVICMHNFFFKKKGENNIFEDVKTNVVNFLLGDRTGLTVIGPASVVKEIRKSPDKIQLYTTNGKTRRKRNGR